MATQTKDSAATRTRRRTPTDLQAAREQRRIEKKNAGRLALIRAAVDVVGKVGYEKASIALITARAKVGIGSFYLYFESRQDLFDQLLPQLGLEMQRHVAERVKGAKDFYEVDKRGLKAFFEFARLNRGFYRVLNEAEAAAPRGFERYNAIMLQRFVVSLERGRAAGNVLHFSGRELVLIAYILMGARLYIHRGFESSFLAEGVPDWIIDTYARFARYGLAGGKGPKTA